MCKCVAVILLTYHAMDHFERAVMATKKTPWSAEICWRFSKVWWTCFVHVKFVINLIFVFQFAIQKYKDWNTQQHNFVRCFLWLWILVHHI